MVQLRNELDRRWRGEEEKQQASRRKPRANKVSLKAWRCHSRPALSQPKQNNLNYISRVRAPLKHQIGAHAFGRLTAPLVLNVDYPELRRKQKKKRASQKPVAQTHRKKEIKSKLNMADDYGKLLFFSFFPFEKHSIQAISCYSSICHLYTYAVSLNPENVHSYPTTLLKLLFSCFLCDHDDDTHGVLLVSPPLLTNITSAPCWSSPRLPFFFFSS